MITTTLDEIKNILCVKKSDFFVSLGTGFISRRVIEDMRPSVDVATGIALSKKELESCNGLRTKIYDSAKSVGGIEVFDKVFCNYADVPQHLQDLDEIIGTCFRLCANHGMVLLCGLTDKIIIQKLLRKHLIDKYWYFHHPNHEGFDVLFKKDSKSNDR